VQDLAIIGGGVNGCGIARDAAGRGLGVFLCEMGDLGAATSAASTKLVHGGLRYLEHYEFRLVREALLEREIIWGIAPHIVWPMRFVLPHHRGLRPAWMLRLGLFLYDHLGGRRRLPPTRGIDLRQDPAGAPLKPIYTRAFEYSDCWVEDSRLVVLNARDAAERGAIIRPRLRCISAGREDGLWLLRLEDAAGNGTVLRARALVNAAGPWVGEVLRGVLRGNAPATVRLVQGSHVVVRKLYDHDRSYIFQNADRRIFFAIPYERDFTLLGTTDQDYVGDPAKAQASAAEIDYICRGASEYFRQPVTPDMVVWSYSGVRPLFDDGASAAQEATRDYVLKLDVVDGAPLLSVFGGKITTYRRLAEDALRRLAPHLPARAGLPAGWTGTQALPGGDFPPDGYEALVAAIGTEFPFLADGHLRRLVRAYGTRTRLLLEGAGSQADLGQVFGADLTEAELRYLMRHEWAVTAADVVWRRSKLGLRLGAEQVASVDAAMHAMTAMRAA